MSADSDRIEDVMQRNWDRRYGTPDPQTKRSQIISDLAAMGQGMFSRPFVPTPEQIAEAMYECEGHPRVEWSALPQTTRDAYLRYADAVLALLQKGAADD